MNSWTQLSHLGNCKLRFQRHSPRLKSGCEFLHIRNDVDQNDADEDGYDLPCRKRLCLQLDRLAES